MSVGFVFVHFFELAYSIKKKTVLCLKCFKHQAELRSTIRETSMETTITEYCVTGRLSAGLMTSRFITLGCIDSFK